MSKWIKTYIIIVTIGFVFFFYLLLSGDIAHRDVSMPSAHYTTEDCVKAYQILENSRNKGYGVLTQKEYRQLLPTKHRIIFSSHKSRAFLQFNIILIDNTLAPIEYCKSLTHEIMHFERYSLNERYICFETFKFLYESHNPYLHNVGVEYGKQQLNDVQDGEYYIKGQIINYLLKERLC